MPLLPPCVLSLTEGPRYGSRHFVVFHVIFGHFFEYFCRFFLFSSISYMFSLSYSGGGHLFEFRYRYALPVSSDYCDRGCGLFLPLSFDAIRYAPRCCCVWNEHDKATSGHSHVDTFADAMQNTAEGDLEQQPYQPRRVTENRRETQCQASERSSRCQRTAHVPLASSTWSTSCTALPPDLGDSDPK